LCALIREEFLSKARLVIEGKDIVITPTKVRAEAEQILREYGKIK
jgi:hypothetical protein